MEVFVGNDHAVYLRGAQAIDVTTGQSLPLGATAVVQFRIQTPAGVDVAGETWPVTMTYIAGSPGDFIGILRAEVMLTAGQQYRFLGTVDNGPDQAGRWNMPLTVHTRME